MRDCGAKKLDDYVNKKGNMVLHEAAAVEGAVQVIEHMMKEKKCCFMTINELTGNTALHVACSEEMEENACYLFTLDYDRCSWYNKDNQSPLYCALNNSIHVRHNQVQKIWNESFFKSIFQSVLAHPWQLEKCVKMMHPFYKLQSEFVDMPLPHYLLVCIINRYQPLHGVYNDRASNCLSNGCQSILNILELLLDYVPSIATMHTQLDVRYCIILRCVSVSQLTK